MSVDVRSKEDELERKRERERESREQGIETSAALPSLAAAVCKEENQFRSFRIVVEVVRTYYLFRNANLHYIQNDRLVPSQ